MHTKAALVEQRSAWARHVNAELERAGRAERVDHRSNAARGIYLEPEGFNPMSRTMPRRRASAPGRGIAALWPPSAT